MHGNENIVVHGNENIVVHGNENIVVHGNENIVVHGNENIAGRSRKMYLICFCLHLIIHLPEQVQLEILMALMVEIMLSLKTLENP